MIFNRYLVVGNSNFSPGDSVPEDWNEDVVAEFKARGDIVDKSEEENALLESIDPEANFMPEIESLDPEVEVDESDNEENDESESVEETEDEDDEESIAPSRQRKRRSTKK